MSKRIFIIINPAAGRNTRARWERLSAVLRRVGLSFDHAVTEAPGEASAIARRHAGTCDLIVAVGGDGTLFEVINGIMAAGDRPPALTTVPFGTGNDSARSMGIHSEADALRAITNGKPRGLDLIEVHCRQHGQPRVQHAMLFASVGITSDLLRHTTPRLKRLCGHRLAYIAGLLLALRSYAPVRMQLTSDHRSVEGSFIFACASNAETFGGGIRIAPGARPDDGKFNLNLIEAVGRIEALRHLQRLRQGRHTTHPRVCYKTAVSLEIETESPIEVAADGDLIGETPARFQLLPSALTFLTPAPDSQAAV